MPLLPGTVTISGVEYPVYADLATADEYLLAAIHAEDWRDEPEEIQARHLVTATRLLDRQRWQGERSDPAQSLAWPRSGISGVPSDELPEGLVLGTIELALALYNGSDAQDRTTTENDLKSLKAGSVALEFIRGVPQGFRFPTIVHELVSRWLQGMGTLSPMAHGVDGSSSFKKDFSLSRGF